MFADVITPQWKISQLGIHLPNPHLQPFFPPHFPPNLPRREPIPDRTVRHVRLPRLLRVQGQVRLRGEERRVEIVRHVGERVAGAEAVEDGDDVGGEEIQEDEVDGRGQHPAGREGRVGLDVVRLGEVGDRGVDGVVAGGAEVVCGVGRGG